MPLTPDQERWAEALAVHKEHCDRARFHVAKRIGTMAMRGDQGGIDRWKEIAWRLDQLMDGTTQ